MEKVKIIKVGGSEPRLAFEKVSTGTLHFFHITIEEAQKWVKKLYEVVEMDLSGKEVFDFVDEDSEASKPSYTKDQFIEHAKAIIMHIESAYLRSSGKKKIDFDKMTEEEIDKLPRCSQCGGSLYYEGGGEIHECTRCDDGVELDTSLDTEKFAASIEELMFESGIPFFELLECEITE